MMKQSISIQDVAQGRSEVDIGRAKQASAKGSPAPKSLFSFGSMPEILGRLESHAPCGFHRHDKTRQLPDGQTY
jgi:hypothetical protein